ncbi:peptidoglycan DD-metalloendopeptidase family protein [uncultured Aquimarina sp.]|uniref:peptidoglycan DD-metalloendopeptidase family protein n=1 Tax=uncultured Aquimarina sp. TaxID=575652 RepID=UPI00263614AB|nr:peptidoglycan DD-metalloendopeptidase family protein [uncultured Aquimarina sp.]
MAGEFVKNGATLKCPLCSGSGKLMVSHSQVKLQDTQWATDADKSKTNLVFGGVCKKWRKSPPPCASVISPTKWKRTADGVAVDGRLALLAASTIKCATGGVPISIANTAQIDVPTDLPDTEEQEQEEEVVNSVWTDPIENSEITLYTFSGNYKPKGSTFGSVRRNRDGSVRNHTGLDIFAETGTTLYACLDGVIDQIYTGPGFGKVIVLKITNVDDLKNAKNGYSLQYGPDEIEKGNAFNYDGKIFLRYAHVEEASVNVGDEVKSGDVIGKSGVSGNASGTRAPHLHFEIANVARSRGLANKINPAFFVNLKLENDANQTHQQLIAQQAHRA